MKRGYVDHCSLDRVLLNPRPYHTFFSHLKSLLIKLRFVFFHTKAINWNSIIAFNSKPFAKTISENRDCSVNVLFKDTVQMYVLSWLINPQIVLTLLIYTYEQNLYFINILQNNICVLYFCITHDNIYVR